MQRSVDYVSPRTVEMRLSKVDFQRKLLLHHANQMP